MIRKLAVFFCVLLMSGCEGAAFLVAPSAPQAQVDRNPLDVDASDAGAAFLMSYPMPGIDGQTRSENAVVLLPLGDAPADGWPVVAWAHQTTGVADSCAPSRSSQLADQAGYLNGWLAAGFAVVAPDYERLGTDGLHPYLNLASSARAVNFAVDAAVAQFPELSERYVVVGHSQGGHAALGAAELAAETADIELMAVVAAAPVSNVLSQDAAQRTVVEDDTVALEDRVPVAAQRLLFGSLILQGVKASNPAFDLDAVYGSSGDNLRRTAATGCIDDIGPVLAGVVPGALLLGGSTDTVIDSQVNNLPEVASYLAANEPGRRAIDVPVMLLQGMADSVVLPDSTDQLAARMQQINGVAPVVNRYDSATHSSVLLISFSDALNFVTSVFLDI